MKQEDIIIRRETPADYAAVEDLTREAFWNVYRPGCMEHYVVHVLRRDPDFVPELDLVMERGGQLIGHILYMRAKITADDGREIPMMTFGPISIRPDLQRQGLGKRLLDYSMERAGQMGAGPCVLRVTSNFTASPALWWPAPGGSAVRGSRNRRSFPMFCSRSCARAS